VAAEVESVDQRVADADEAAGRPTGRRRGRWIPEALGVTLLASVLTAAMNMSMVKALSTSVPRDTADPLYFAWQLAWIGHALGTDPAGLYQSRTFLGAPNNLAYTDMVIGYGPLAWVLGSGHEAALRLINVALLVSLVLSFLGAYALARVLGARVPAALLAGAGFAFAPWRLEQITHINVMSTGVALLALAALCRGHGWSLSRGWEPSRVHAGWILTGWLLACYQLTFGFALGVTFGWVLLLVVGSWVIGWLLTRRRRAARGAPQVHGMRWVALAELLGGAGFAATGLFLTRPYFWVVEHFPEARRGEEWLFLSPPWRGLLTAPETSVWWGDRHEAWRKDLDVTSEMTLLPGFLLIGLAVLGLFLSSWSLRRRMGLFAVTAVITVLSMGIRFPGEGKYTFLPLYHHLPGWDALRTPGRLMIWVTVGLCLLAAGAVDKLTTFAFAALNRRRQENATPAQRAAAVLLAAAAVVGLTVPAAAVTLEGRGDTPMWEVEFPQIDLAALPQPVLILPFEGYRDYRVMAWQSDGWPIMANGSSSFEPKYQETFRKTMETFPSPEAVALVRQRGVKTVVLILDWAPGSAWADTIHQPVNGLIKRVDNGQWVIYDTR